MKQKKVLRNIFFEPLLQKYQEGVEDKVRGSEFVFDSVY